jgi:uncharacterized protein YjbI with pentapeptide repeats
MKIHNLLIAAGFICAIATSTAPAFDQAHYQSVKQGQGDCPWCDLSGADLANLKLSGADLGGADLTEADLTGAVLTKVDLSGADLTGAVLTGADLSGAVLTGADLDQVDLSGAVLEGAILEKAYCDWGTKLPEGLGLACVGVAIERQ